ncbi:MAG: hypothetical protein AAF517_26040, partial [Planctomycetota bacterium]
IRFQQIDGVLFRRGNANDDEQIDISDSIQILSVLFLNEPFGSCPAAADANGDGQVDISDPIYLIGYLFLGQPGPSTRCELLRDGDLPCETGSTLCAP